MLKFIIFIIFLIPLAVQIILNQIKKREVKFKDIWFGIIVAILGVFVLVILDQIVSFIVDVLWFQEIGYFNIFWSILEYKIGIFIITFSIVFIGFVLFIYVPLKFFFPKFPIGIVNVREFELMKSIEKFSSILLWLI
ncbi:MAG: UPF0182 family protein, partial [Brevinematia bacterium]